MSRISIIVPVYMVEPYLQRCLDSILAQTFTDFELILVDDGSPDNCGRICDEYAAKDSRVRVIHQENGGLSAARNAGIDWVFANSDSQWLTFVDSDDWVLPIYLESLYDAVQKWNTGISMCWLYRTQGEEPVIDYEHLEPVLRSAEDAYTENGKGASAHAPARLYAKELFSGVRFPEGKVFEDIFTTHKVCFSQLEIAVIEQFLYCYYINYDGIALSKNTAKRIQDEYDALEVQIEFFFTNGYKMAEKLRIYGYLNGITALLKEVKKNKRENAEIITLLKKKKRTHFRKYAQRLSVAEQTDAWVLTKTFPFQMKIYWVYRAFTNKAKCILNWRKETP